MEKKDKPKDFSHMASSEDSSDLKRYCGELFQQSQMALVSQFVSLKSIPRKIIKSVFFLACLIGFTYQTSSFLIIYYQYPSTMYVDVEFAERLHFPAITICNNNRLRKSSIQKLDPKLYDNFSNLSQLMDHEKIVNYIASSSRSKIMNMASNVSDFIQCTIKSYLQKEICSRIAFSYSPLFTSCYSYNTWWKTPTTHSPMAAYGDEINFEINFEAEEFTEEDREIGGKLIISGLYDLVYADSEGFEIEPGFSYQIAMKQQTKISLPQPYKTNCSDYPVLWKANNGTGSLTWKMCVIECVKSTTRGRCGCVPLWIPLVEEDDFCNPYDPEEDSCIKTIISSVKRNCEVGCRQECFVRIYESQLKKKTYPARKQYDIEVFSFIGGYIGIWLGISLLAILDFIESIILLFRFVLKTYIKKKKVATQVLQGGSWAHMIKEPIAYKRPYQLKSMTVGQFSTETKPSWKRRCKIHGVRSGLHEHRIARIKQINAITQESKESTP
ncbi:acid-sensing ion channel 4-like [Limulus polyphemus]|uniref:Acid-sensing ion channel 4-like n=1 Tax=Limulus polyphemus TaxID=6850 RepID=A0ABM1S0I1_LIMPO|nr:acid-sensing ion channel 4-like [Limulus polyphemus]